MNKEKTNKFNYKINRIYIENLKGIRGFTLDKDITKNVTAIVGVNGSGKSTIIHALACAFKPIGKATAKDYNRLSDFFTPNKHSTWDGSEFHITFSFNELNPKRKPQLAEKTHTETFYKKPGVKQSRWQPIYGRRHERESHYIGLHSLSTLNEDKYANKYREYDTEEIAHKSAEKIKNDLEFVLGRNYESLYSCKSKNGNKVFTMFGLRQNNVTYSELSMGAGEKRVLDILYALHNPALEKGGLLLIDELDVLLHGHAFARLVETLVKRSQENKLEVFFSTHRETIINYQDDINICGIFNTGNGVIAMPHTNPQVFGQLTGRVQLPLHICVEDDLAESIILNLLYMKKLHAHVQVTKFGAWSNAFAILAGKILMGSDISNTICVLDGDVCRDSESREEEAKRHLNGDDKVVARKMMLNQIKEFKIKYMAPNGQKGSPEFNIKKLFEESEVKNTKLIELQAASRTIQSLHDWHTYFDGLVDQSNQRHARDNILSHLEEDNEWFFLLSEIIEWLDIKVKEMNIII